VTSSPAVEFSPPADVCGVCGGNGSQCAGCDGEPFSGIHWDECGVCGGNNECQDCAGEVDGPHRLDLCGNCLEPVSTCSDGPHMGLPCVSHENCPGSRCSTAGAPITPRAGHHDVPGAAIWNGCVDCAGVVNGPAVRDSCGVCNGQDTSCVAGYSVYQAPGDMVCLGDVLRVGWRTLQPPPRPHRVIMGYRRLANGVPVNSSGSGLLAGWAYIDPPVACGAPEAGDMQHAAIFRNQDDEQQLLGQSRWVDLRPAMPLGSVGELVMNRTDLSEEAAGCFGGGGDGGGSGEQGDAGGAEQRQGLSMLGDVLNQTVVTAAVCACARASLCVSVCLSVPVCVCVCWCVSVPV